MRIRKKYTYNPNQIALPFTDRFSGRFASSKITHQNDIFLRKVFKVLSLSFVTLCLLYVFFLGNIVFNIMERKNYASEIKTLTSDVGKLELLYLSMTNDIDMGLGNSMGFKETRAKFANRYSENYRVKP